MEAADLFVTTLTIIFKHIERCKIYLNKTRFLLYLYRVFLFYTTHNSEKILHHRVVQTVSLSRHTLNYMMLFKPFPISEVLVLLTLIRMKYESVKVITLIKCFIEHVIYLFKMKCTLLHFIFLGISPNNLMSALTIEPVRCLQRTSP